MAGRNPYVGLVPYTEADAEWFFGRHSEQRIIAANLRASRLTLLYGASGVGKSSVLLAGVLPELRAMVGANRARPRDAAHPGDGLAVAERAPFAVAVFRDWRDPPIASLAETIRASVVEASGEAVEGWDPDEPLQNALLRWTSHVRTLLVILDQVEEYFLYHADEEGPGTFADEFASVVNDADLRVNFLLSLREDAWAKLDRFKGEIPELFSNYLRVDYLHRDAAREAIVRPVEKYNEGLADPAERVEIDDDLIEEVLDDVRAGRLALAESRVSGEDAIARADDGNRIETPYLQLVMARLWRAAQAEEPRKLSLATLTGLGGAEAIVSSHLREALDHLSAEDQSIAADIFGFLVTPSKTKIAHSASDLAYWAKCDEADVRRVLDELSTGEWRILRAVPPPPEESVDRYEIFHDVLAEAVLDWRKRKEREREEAAIETRLRAEARARRKARRERFVRRGAIGLVVLVVALAVVVALAIHRASRNAAKRDQERSVGLAASAKAQLPVDPERSLLLALAALHVKHIKPTPEAIDVLATSLATSRVRATLTGARSSRCGAACRPHLPPGGGGDDSTPVGNRAALTRDDPAATRVSLTADGGTAAIVMNGHVWLWQPATGGHRRLRGVRGATTAVLVPGDRQVLALEDTRAILVPVDGRAAPRVVSGDATSATVSDDGAYVATASVKGVVVREVSGGAEVARVAEPDEIQGIAFDPSDSHLLEVETTGGTGLWRWRREARPRLLAGTTPPLTGRTPARFSPDGKWLATAATRGGAAIWDVASAHRLYRTSPDGPATVRAMFNRDGTRLLTMSDRVATLRNARSGEALAVLAGPVGTIASAAFSPDGALVATGGDDGVIRVFEAAAGAELMELRGHSEKVADLEFTSDARFLISVADDGSGRLWQVAEGAVAPRFHGKVTGMAVSRDGRRVAVATDEGTAFLWTPRDGRVSPLAKDVDAFASAALTPDGSVAAFGTEVGPVQVVDTRTGKPRPLRGATGAVVQFTRDGRSLLTAGSGVPRMWSLADGTSRPLGRIAYGDPPRLPRDGRGPVGPSELQLEVLGDPIVSAAFSRDSEHILLTTRLGTARIISARTGLTERVSDRQRQPRPGPDSVIAGGFDRDGRSVVTAGDREAIVWSARTGRIRFSLEGHTGAVTGAAFSDDGRWIVTSGDDQTTRVFDARDGHAVAVLRNHASRVSQVAFGPGGDTIISADEAGTVRQYPCVACEGLARLRALAASRVTRGLTPQERAAYELGRS